MEYNFTELADTIFSLINYT